MVVISIIAIMAALLASAVHGAKEKSRGITCRNNMKQLAYAFTMYADENSDFMPWPGGEPDRANTNPNYSADWCAGGQSASDLASQGKWNEDSFGFHAESGSVFPYVYSLPRKAYDEKNKDIYPVYRCPSTGQLGEKLRVNYVANSYMDPGKPFGDGVVNSQGVLKTSINDPVRKVMLMNEDPRRITGAGFAPSPTGPSGHPILHQGKVNVSFMDLHIEALSNDFILNMQKDAVDTYYNLGK